MALERKLWLDLRTCYHTNKSIFLQRIESRTAYGIPDVWWCARKQTGWLELKAIDHWPTDGVDVSIHSYTIQQRRWLLRVHNLGGRVGIVLAVGREVFWLDGLAAVELGYRSREEIEYNASAKGVNAFLDYVSRV